MIETTRLNNGVAGKKPEIRSVDADCAEPSAAPRGCPVLDAADVVAASRQKTF